MTKNKSRKGTVAVLIVLILVLLAADYYLITRFRDREIAKINTRIELECGQPLTQDMLMNAKPAIEDLVSTNLDVSVIDTKVPQTVMYNFYFWREKIPCEIKISDTIPPSAEAVPQKLYSFDNFPEAEEVVTNVYDLSPCTISYKDFPDMGLGGHFDVRVSVKDSSGNETIVPVPFDVTYDGIAPQIYGAKDLSVFIGDTISYRDGVTVADNLDPKPELTIDTSQVNLKREGTYPVTYTATDFAGNSSSVTVNITLTVKPDGYVDPEVVYEKAREILEQITTPGMSDLEVALQITYWCRYQIHYGNRSVSTSWTAAAYQGLTSRSGRCYTYAMSARALFDAAGIENKIVKREKYGRSGHYWNYIKIDGQWYHCDSTPRHTYGSYVFGYTTKELQAFSVNGYNGYYFTVSKYPESAKDSIQDRIDYRNHKILY
ncbi:MAG: transglutaminase domain-containing protein [Clostridiales bacterium]|nr:transglutaminase domain-containing protein [Clostridiales bacterium]